MALDFKDELKTLKLVKQKFHIKQATTYEYYSTDTGLSSFTDKISNGQNPEIEKIRSTKSRIGQIPKQTRSRIEQIPEWTKSKIGQNPELDKISNGKNPEMDKIPNWTKSRIGQNPKWTKSE